MAAGALAIGATAVDESFDTSPHLRFLFAGGPEGALALLSAIITLMITFTGLVSSITIVVGPGVSEPASASAHGYVCGTR